MEIKMKSILMILVLSTSLLSLGESQNDPYYLSTDPAIRNMLISMNTPGSPIVTDPAIRSMEMSMNAPSNPVVTDPAIRNMLISMNMSRYLGYVPAETIAGNWQLNLSDGTSIDLKLLQSAAAVFGKGKMAIGTVSQGISASGSVSGSRLNLDIVPESGTQLYVFSVDINSPPFEGNYVVFLANSEAQTGTLRAYKNMPTVKSTVIPMNESQVILPKDKP
jgi:hypothetical protein